MRIRVLFIINNLRVGGAERVVVHTINAIDRRRFEPWLCCLEDNNPLLRDVRLPRHRILTLGERPARNSASLAFRLARFIRSHRFDVVHTHLYPAGTVGRIASVLAGAPVLIHTVHNTYNELSPRTILIDRFLSRFTSRILFVSRAVQEFILRKERLPYDKIEVLYNPVPVEELQAARYSSSALHALRSTLRVPPGGHLLLQAARMVPQKGHLSFLELFPRILQRRPRTILALAGDGPERARIESRVSKLRLSGCVRVLGNRSDLYALMKAADLVVNPSTREGMPMVLIEASALGAPIVATSVGGTPEIVLHNETGLLVPAEAPEALVGAILSLLDLPSLRRWLSVAAARRAREYFSTQVIIPRLEKIYAELLSPARRHPLWNRVGRDRTTIRSHSTQPAGSGSP